MKMEFSPKQTLAYRTLEQPDVDDLLYGGAKGGGKSVFGCRWLFLELIALIKKYGIKRSAHPEPLAFMGRKRSVDFTKTTLETWKSFIPSEAYLLRKGDHEIVIDNRVKIDFGGLDDSKTVRKFNSAEYVRLFIDQAEELTPDDYALVHGTLRRKINGIQPTYKSLLTANPEENWLKNDFISNPQPRTKFIQALPIDNPFLATGYIDNLRKVWRHRPERLRAYVEGSWDDLSANDTVIKGGWVSDAVNRILTRINTKRIVSIDPAAFGDDESIIYALENERVIDTEALGQREPMETAGHAVIMRKKWGANLIAGDGIGIGSGIFSRLREMGEPTRVLISSESSTNEEKYKNLRAEMWWEVGEMFCSGLVSIPDDPMLKGQLSAVKYNVSSDGQIRVEPKEETKKRLGRSPDRADALVYGLYSLRYAEYLKEPKEWRTSYKETDKKQKSYMAA